MTSKHRSPGADGGGGTNEDSRDGEITASVGGDGRADYKKIEERIKSDQTKVEEKDK